MRDCLSQEFINRFRKISIFASISYSLNHFALFDELLKQQFFAEKNLRS